MAHVGVCGILELGKHQCTLWLQCVEWLCVRFLVMSVLWNLANCHQMVIAW